MKGLREFEIPYIGLKVGVHEFNYDIDGKFFSHFPDSLIQNCNVHVKVEFEKKETFFIVNFFIDGTVNVECDRCLIAFDKSIFGDYTCYVKFSENPLENNDEPDVMFISREQTVIDLSQLVYEYINLCLPMQKTGCEKPGEEPQCNKEILNYLNKQKNTDEEETDPRWAALQNLKKSNS